VRKVTVTRDDGTEATYPAEFLTRHEVAALFRVEPHTVTRWARAGLLTRGHTPGGQPRYAAAQVDALLHGSTQVRQP
jgi:predicted site-specific integrase-resolvase